MARSIWRSDKVCPDLEPGMVIKYANRRQDVSGYYLITFDKNIVLALKSDVTSLAGLGHLGPVDKGSVLEVWASLYDFLMDNGVDVLNKPIDF